MDILTQSRWDQHQLYWMSYGMYVRVYTHIWREKVAIHVDALLYLFPLRESNLLIEIFFSSLIFSLTGCFLSSLCKRRTLFYEVPWKAKEQIRRSAEAKIGTGDKKTCLLAA